MFGTLVICLNSPHEGGQVKVKHQLVEKVFDTSKTINSFAAWYGDVTHEVLTVQSGYRWVLTYNLAIDPTAMLPTASLQANTSEVAMLETILRPWASMPKTCRVPTHLYYALEHKYTEASIGSRGLKQLDLARVQALQKLSRSLPIKVFLAVVKKEAINAIEEDGMPWDDEPREDWDPEEAYDSDPNDRMTSGHPGEELDKECKVKKVVDLDGNVVLRDAAFNEQNFLQEECFDPENADDEEFSGFTGNEVRRNPPFYGFDLTLSLTNIGRYVNIHLQCCRKLLFC